MTQVFEDADLLVPLDSPEGEKREWKPRDPRVKKNAHIGQLKLLTAEIVFLSLGVDDVENCVVVYAGAAGGHHIPALAELYPKLQFYLYDPAPFAIKETQQLHIINGIFTNEIAAEWGRRRKERSVLFISDVRTSGDTAEEHEGEVEANMQMQARWVELMQPALKAYSLKFRIPFTIIEADRPYKYLGGRLVYQAYPKADSMELRLFGDSEDAMAGPEAITYDSRSLEQTVFYHNSIIRPNHELYANIFTETDEPYKDPQFDRGYDCTYFMYCVKRYLERTGRTRNLDKIVPAMVKRMVAITSQGNWTLGDRKVRTK